MGRINLGKVIVGGLVAGVILNVFDIAGAMLLFQEDMKELVARLHLDPAVMNTDMAHILPWIIIDFILGILLVLAYATMRPRFGPGPKTALMSGFLLYATVTVLMYGFMKMGIFTSAAFVKNSMFYLVAWLVASVAGAALYKET
jgi:hypothetical protein